MMQSGTDIPSETTGALDQTSCPPFCGIIMPIAAMGTYEKSHWDRVRIILDEAIAEAGYVPRLVSESEDIGVIHARIVQNLYDDPIVVCDVSGKNANVMFELGLRLAFDKPTIVIKDDQTDYSFDTSPIKHINYRADLRFDDVRAFKENVIAAIRASVSQKERDPTFSPFLAHFGKFRATGPGTKEVNSGQFMIDQMAALRTEVAHLANRIPHLVAPSIGVAMDEIERTPFGNRPTSDAAKRVAEALQQRANGSVVQHYSPLSSRRNEEGSY